RTHSSAADIRRAASVRTMRSGCAQNLPVIATRPARRAGGIDAAGITRITWDERNAASRPTTRTRDQALQLLVRGTVHGTHQRHGEVVQRREGLRFHLA